MIHFTTCSSIGWIGSAQATTAAFWAGLAGAGLLHAALILGRSSGSTPRQLGETDGLMEAISVECASRRPGWQHRPAGGRASPEPGSNSALRLAATGKQSNSWQTSTAPDKPETQASEAKPQQQAMLALLIRKPEAQASRKNHRKSRKSLRRSRRKGTPPKETQKEGQEGEPEERCAQGTREKDKQASTQLDFSLPSSLFNAPCGGGGLRHMRPAGITRSGRTTSSAARSSGRCARACRRTRRSTAG